MKPLIILGNGNSLKNIDLNLLTHQDTFGLNGAFLNFSKISFYPTYFGFFPRGPNFWNWEDINNFVFDNHLKIKKFFFFEWDKDDLLCHDYKIYLYLKHLSDQIIFLQAHWPDYFNIDHSKWSLPLNVEIGTALDHRNKELKKEGYENEKLELKIWQDNHYLMRYENAQKIKKLNHIGILKLLKDEELTANDYIKFPRFKESWCLPTSWNNFTFSGGNASVIACLIGYLLGYKKIILLGMDCNWKTSFNLVNTKESYWFDEYFNNYLYDIRNFCQSCTTESLQKMQLDSWLNLKEKFEVNNVDIDIVNCTEGSALEYFRKSTLEKEL